MNLFKSKLTEALFKAIENIKEVISVTLVGSFIDKKDLSGISDIDTIVICNQLNPQRPF